MNRNRAIGAMTKTNPSQLIVRDTYGSLPVTGNAVSNAQIVQLVVVHGGLNRSHCSNVLEYVGDALHVSLNLGWLCFFLLRALTFP